MTLEKIKDSLISEIKIYFIEIHDHSLLHNHLEKGLTHLTITIVSNDFINTKLIDRHRMIFKILSKIVQKKIYSITLNTFSVNEWQYKKYKINNNSKCLKQK